MNDLQLVTKEKPANVKIMSLSELAGICSNLRGNQKRIVHCHGCFDLLHPGHIKHLEAARKYGDILIVTITPDIYVNKGPDRPMFNQRLRMESVASLSTVDYVSLNRWEDASEAILLLKPDVFAIGSEYKDAGNEGVNKELKALGRIHGQIVYTNEITFSSSHIFNKNFYSPELTAFLRIFRESYTYDDIIGYITQLKNLSILVIGELVIDEYVYGEYLGKMRRESIMEFISNETKRFLGGTGIIANHLAGFAENVTLVSMVGDRDGNRKFIGASLDPRVDTCFFIKTGCPTPLKRRYIDRRIFLKIFKSAALNDHELEEDTTRRIMCWLEDNLPSYDVVLVADYGHGMLNEPLRNLLMKHARFLAVNTQINIENRGYNTIDKYQQVDYACINEDELRLVTKDKYGDIHKLIPRLLQKSRINQLSITRGNHGCITQMNNDTCSIPAFTLNTFHSAGIHDAMGAGDAFFALTAPLASRGIPSMPLGFIGNATGDLHTKTMGNEKAIEKTVLLDYMRSLMK